METLSKNKIKLIRSLQRKKTRDELGLFIVEGKKSVSEALKERPDLIEFICTSVENEILHPDQFYLSDQELKATSSLTSGTKWLAVCRKPDISGNDNGIIIALDGVQDPGNMGTIMRTSDWFGINHIICSKDTVDCYNEKVVQASMGSIFRVLVEYADLDELLENYDGPIYGALMEGENVFKMKFDQKGIILLGNEGNGIRPSTIEKITHPVHIPGAGNVESLNVAVAGGILIAEIKGRSI